MSASDPETRAQRLGTSILTFGIVTEPPRDAIRGTHACRLVTEDEWQAWREGDDEDIDIANACLAVEREVRNAEWAALELLDLAYNAPEVKLPASVASDDPQDVAAVGPGTVLVPRAQLAAIATLALGWHLAPPKGK